LKFSLLFRFVFASFHFFASKGKNNFASISLRSENYVSFSLPFRFISLRSEKDGSFSLPFCFKAKIMAVFCFFFVFFSLRSIFVSLQIYTFRIDEKQAKKAPFRFEAKMTAHPTVPNRVTSSPPPTVSLVSLPMDKRWLRL
jgi:hypothetical protein